MTVFVLERYACGLTLDGVHQAAARVAGAADVTHLLSLFVPGDDAALSVFTADTIGQLEGAARSEGTPFERIVQADLVRLDPAPQIQTDTKVGTHEVVSTSAPSSPGDEQHRRRDGRGAGHRRGEHPGLEGHWGRDAL